MPSRLDFSVGIGAPRQASRRSEGDPMRLLLIGDFSGRGARGMHDAASLAQRKLHRVDLDTLDPVFARIAPAVALAAEPGSAATTLEFRDRDDFHPDRLYARVAAFARLRELRVRLLDPSSFKAAAAELRVDAPELPAPLVAGSAAASSAAPVETDAGTLERLLGDASATSTAAAPRPGQTVEALIRDAVAPHIVPDYSAMQAQYVEALDSEVSAQLRRVMHDAGFSALEGAWRGVQWLVSRLELSEDLQLYLLDVTRDELAADLQSARANPSQSGLHRALCSRALDGAPGWSLLAGLFSVGPAAEDLDLVAGLGAIASHIGVAVVLAATPSLVGCDSVANLADPRAWQALDADAATRWRSLRQGPLAPWIGLVAPRILLRLPYGKRTDAAEQFAFEEQPAEPLHEAFLWGLAPLAIALVAGRGYAEGGWEGAANPSLDIDQLPAYSFVRDGDAQRLPCAEVWLDERAGEALLAQGVMAIASDPQSAAVRVLRMQSISPANPRLGGAAAYSGADD